MQIGPRLSLIILILCALALSGCSGDGKNTAAGGPASSSNQNANSANAARTNVEELSLLVDIPYETEDVAWKEVVAGKRVLAALRFSAADADKLVLEAERTGAPEAARIGVESWFPVELIAQGGMSGDSMLTGLAYPATGFARAPYTSGRVVRIEGTDYFVLELSAQ